MRVCFEMVTGRYVLVLGLLSLVCGCLSSQDGDDKAKKGPKVTDKVSAYCLMGF